MKTKVLVRGVNNLSAARYCASIAVEWISFNVNENMPIEKIEAIISWTTGVKYVCELSEKKPDWLKNKEHLFDFYLVKNDWPKNKKKNILRITPNYIDKLALQRSLSDAVWLLEGLTSEMIYAWDENKKLLLNQHNIIVNIEKNDENLLKLLLCEANPNAVALQSPNEIKPGMLNLDNFSNLLEQLDIY